MHEWTESTRTPTEWNTLSATPQGAGLGITGTVADTTNYVTRKKYDPRCRKYEKYLLLLG